MSEGKESKSRNEEMERVLKNIPTISLHCSFIDSILTTTCRDVRIFKSFLHRKKKVEGLWKR